MDIIELHEEKKEPKKYTVEEVLNSLYFEEVDSAGDYDGYLHITSTLDGNGTKILFSDFTLQEQRHQEEMKGVLDEKEDMLGFILQDIYLLKGDLMYIRALKDVEDIINKKLQNKI
jgi:hypothetical protein